jgi:sugar phosphate isomerase/epimerase
MKPCVTSWSFPACTLAEVAGIVQALGIDAIDLGFFYASGLNRTKLLEQPKALARTTSGLGVRASNLYYLFGAGLEDRNLAQGSSLKANLEDFKKVVRFCRLAKIPSVMLLPGVINPGQTRRQAFEQSAKSLQELLPIAQDAGVTLAVEPHVHSYLESPSLTLELLSRLPELRLVLDYAHFTCLGYRQEEIDVLAPHAAHIHLRQARMGVLQAKLEQGTIHFPALLGTLRECGYTGYLALEYVHQDYMGTLYDDVLSETIKLRDLVRRFT